MVQEIAQLKKCLELIEDKLGWGDSREWTNGQYGMLSEMIEGVSGILISISTLKRVFGKAKTNSFYNPQLATKNALAIFLGFRNWEDFFINHQNVAFSVEEKDIEVVEAKSAHETNRWKRAFFVSIFISIGVLGYFVIKKYSLQEDYKPRIAGRYTYGKAPLTTAFYYDISKLKGDNYYLEIDPRKIPLSKGLNYTSVKFTDPGYFKVKLMSEGEELSVINVHALSDGWYCQLGSPSFNDNYVVANTNILADGKLFISPALIAQQGADTTQEYWVKYRNIKDFNCEADNCTLEAKIQNSKLSGGPSCYDAELEIVAENDFSIFRFVEEGCSRWAYAEISEVILDGNFNNLEAITTDLSSPKIVKLELKNKVGTIYFDDKPVYKLSYRKPLGKLKGIGFTFKGSGRVDDVRLLNGSGKTVYFEDFNGRVSSKH
jgi:hypothetical protein